MRVAIVGASNCILQGTFVEIIKHSKFVTQVDNFSLGGSTTVLLPYAHLTYDLPSYDVVIIDTMINEYLETRPGGRYAIDTGMKMLRTFVGDMKKRGQNVIFTMMPHKQALKTDAYDLYALYKSAAALLGCQVIDLTEAVMAAMLKGVHPDSLWQDETHITPLLQRVIARRVLLTLAQYKNSMDFAAGATKPDLTAPSEPLVARSDFIAGDAPIELIQRHSNLVSPIYHQLPLKTPIEFYVPSGSIYGIVYNSVQFAGHAQIKTDHGDISFPLGDDDVETRTWRPNQTFRHRVIPFDQIRTPDESALSGTITLEAREDSPAIVAEIDCLYGGPLAALPVPNYEGYFAEQEELNLLLDDNEQAA